MAFIFSPFCGGENTELGF
jgi:hypothetical protein